MKKEVLDYIKDIDEAMEDVMDFVDGMDYEGFLKNRKEHYAVIRAIEIIGEATKNVPDSVRSNYPQIPWKDMAGMRDKLIHEYSGVDLKRVWRTAKVDIPELKPLFEEILENFE